MFRIFPGPDRDPPPQTAWRVLGGGPQFEDDRAVQRLMIGKVGTSAHVEALDLGCFQARDVFDGQVAQYVSESLWTALSCGETNVMQRF